MKKVAIIGSQDLAQQIVHFIHTDSKTHRVVGFYDDFQEKGKLIKEVPILGRVEDVEQDYSNQVFDELLIGVGYQHFRFRKASFERFKGSVPFHTFVHSSCIVEQNAKIGEGCVVYPGSIIDQNVTIEDNVLINLGCSISHETTIKQHSYLSPRVSIAGKSMIGECCFIGIGAVVIDHLFITDEVVIGSGANVVKDLKAPGIYVGNPTRKIKGAL